MNTNTIVHTIISCVLLATLSLVIAVALSWSFIYFRNESCNFSIVLGIYSRYSHWFSLTMVIYFVMVLYSENIITLFHANENVSNRVVKYTGATLALSALVYGNIITQSSIVICEQA